MQRQIQRNFLLKNNNNKTENIYAVQKDSSNFPTQNLDCVNGQVDNCLYYIPSMNFLLF